MKSIINAYVEYETAQYIEDEAKKKKTNKSRIIEEAIQEHKKRHNPDEPA